MINGPEVSRMPRRRWRSVTAAIMLVSSAAVTAAVAVPPPVGATVSFQAVSSAEGVRVSTVAGGAPVSDQPADAGSPVSQATLDSLGTSRAYASAVFPGDLLVSLPGLIAGVSNGQLTPPNYPVIAASDRETRPDQEVSGPGMSMRAASSDHGSAATTVVGSVTTSATTESTADGRVTSRSESVIVGLTSDLLKIGNLRSTATIALEPDGTVKRSSTFEVSGLEVAGVKVAVDRGGLSLGDKNAPLPSSGDVAKALAEAGVELKLLEVVETPDSIVGQGLEISATRDTGGSVTPVRVQLRFGRAAASVRRTGSDLVAGPLTSTPESQSPPVAPSASMTAIPQHAPLGPEASPDGASAGGALPVPSSSPIPPLSGPSPAVGGSVAAGAGSGSPERPGPPPVALPARPAQLAVAGATRFDTRGIYLLLVAMTVLAGAGGFLVAKLGVRLR